MKYIFLDVDGVLNTESSWAIRRYDLNINCIDVLAKICKKTGAVIVLTSSWKTGFYKRADKKSWTPQIQKLDTMFTKKQISIYDRTPDWKDKMRSDEIDAYLKRYPAESYVILDDDMSLFESGTKNLYKVNSITGLTDFDAKKIIKILK